MNELDPKQQNLNKVLGLFFEHEALSRPQLAELADLSMPTVTAHMKDLEQRGLIEPGPLLRSSGGRPALSYQLRAGAHLAAGVEVRRDHINMCVCDLRGTRVHSWHKPLPYHDDPGYSAELRDTVLTCLRESGIDMSTLCGVGVGLQAIISHDGTRISFAKILPITTFSTVPLEQALGVPVRMSHDVKAAALAELWHNRQIHNAIYIALSEHLGGALIKSRTIEHGRSGYAGSWDHLTLADNGRICYCGRRGCVDTFCNTGVLLGGESANTFFDTLRAGHSQDHLQRWQDYLNYLTTGLYQAFLMLERRIILGGDLARYLTEGDVASLENGILRLSTFNYEPGFVARAVVLEYAVAMGVALPFLAAYIPPHVRPIAPWPAGII